MQSINELTSNYDEFIKSLQDICERISKIKKRIDDRRDPSFNRLKEIVLQIEEEKYISFGDEHYKEVIGICMRLKILYTKHTYGLFDIIENGINLFKKKFEATISTEGFYGNEIIYKLNLKVLL